MDNLTSVLVLVNCFFNHKLVDRTLTSVKNSKLPGVTICMLENPSEHSDEMADVARKHDVDHYLADDNIEGNIFTSFVNQFPDEVRRHKYIAMTEGDVVLEDGALHEVICLLDRNDHRVGCASIGIRMDTHKYYGLPINKWVPKPVSKGGYPRVGPTGFQFIVFKRGFLFDFIDAITNEMLQKPVALGSKKFSGISDANLEHFVRERGMLWVQTRRALLDHIGWELYLDSENAYVKLKNMTLHKKIIRHSVVYSTLRLVSR